MRIGYIEVNWNYVAEGIMTFFFIAQVSGYVKTLAKKEEVINYEKIIAEQSDLIEELTRQNQRLLQMINNGNDRDTR